MKLLLSFFKDVFDYRQMLTSLVRKDLRSRYRGSFLGFLWTFVNPLLQLIVFSFVFPVILKNTEVNFPLFLFVALLPWMMITGSVQASTTSIVANSNLVKKIYFPRQIIPLSITTANLVNYLYTFIILIPILLLSGINLSYEIVYLILPIVIIYVISFSLGLIFSSLYVKFRDLEHIIGIFIMLWFYLTPVVFPTTIFPENILRYIRLNPLVSIMDFIRDILLYDTTPKFNTLIYPSLFAIVTLVIGILVFSVNQKSFAEEL
jgi:ABC-2 type transport system permease protein